MNIEVKIDKEAEKFYGELSPETPGSAGIDLRTMSDIELWPGVTWVVDTGLSIWIQDPSVVGLVFARSGLSIKRDLAPANKVGVIDSDYQGPLKVALLNHGENIQEIKAGDRIAQLVLVPVFKFNPVYVNEFSNETTRNVGGFGHTGR